jgi:hypothetical protein
MFIDACTTLRVELFGVLTDDDLAFSPGGTNLPLGELLVQMGEVEHSYLHGVKTLKQSWGFHNTEPGLSGSIERLTAWFNDLDAELTAVLGEFGDDDLTRQVVRESGYVMPIEMSLDVYVQAMLIYFGKATIYLKAMNRPLPETIEDWIW